MKTLKDLEDMKSQKCAPFENAYEYFFMQLTDFYIAKTNGIERIKKALADWDIESQQFIVKEIEKRVKELGIQDFELRYKS